MSGLETKLETQGCGNLDMCRQRMLKMKFTGRRKRGRP